jgi:hypothetical protein
MPGNAIAVESRWAASQYGPALVSHEVAHNLGLDHVEPSTPSLMNPSLTGNTSLASWQAAEILASPLVHFADGLRYLSITPVAVIGSAAGTAGGGAGFTFAAADGVPEPGSLPLGIAALIAWACSRRWATRARVPTVGS